MKQEQKLYDAAFKRQGVELSKDRKNLSELARKFGIHVTLLYKSA